MNDSTKAQFDVLAGMMKHDLNHDLDINRKNISPYLAGEIVSRYYDQTVDTAVTVLTTPRYNSIIHP